MKPVPKHKWGTYVPKHQPSWWAPKHRQAKNPSPFRLGPAALFVTVTLAVPLVATASATISDSPAPEAASLQASILKIRVPDSNVPVPDPVTSRDTTRLLINSSRRLAHIEWLRDLRAARHRAWLKRRAAAKAAAARAAAEEASLAAAEDEAAVEGSSPPSAPASSGADWYAVAACESGGDWSINSGNGFWGGLQFTPQTWFGYGGGPFSGSGPFPYSVGQQIAVAERVLAAQGPSAWPNCFAWA